MPSGQRGSFYDPIKTVEKAASVPKSWDRILFLQTLSFHVLAWRGRPPRFGTQNDTGAKDKWLKLSDVPYKMSPEVDHGEDDGGGAFTPFERLTPDLVVLVLKVTVEYNQQGSSAAASSSSSSSGGSGDADGSSIKSIRLLVWDGSAWR